MASPAEARWLLELLRDAFTAQGEQVVIVDDHLRSASGAIYGTHALLVRLAHACRRAHLSVLVRRHRRRDHGSRTRDAQPSRSPAAFARDRRDGLYVAHDGTSPQVTHRDGQRIAIRVEGRLAEAFASLGITSRPA